MIRGGLAIFFLIIWPEVAGAHSGGTTGFASVALSGHTVRYSVTLHDIPPGALAEQMRLGQPGVAPDYRPLIEAIRGKIRLASDGMACAPSGGQLLVPSADSISITGTVDFTCAGEVRELSIRDDMADVLGASHHTLTLLVGPEGSDQFTFEAEIREMRWTPGQKARAVHAARRYFPLGFAHILSGYDLLLFLLVLLLRGGGRVRLLGIIAAFTAAHSATLALAAFDFLTIPDRLTGALVAASIAYIAAENLFPKYAIARRWAVSLVFGLVHGFAFARALREIGLPHENLAASLLYFNLGIEAGQAMVVLLIVPILVLMNRKFWEPKLVATISAIVLAVGSLLFFERALIGV
ncbi:MAG: HupE/UreJ family protein [Burkholderiales bacterium]